MPDTQYFTNIDGKYVKDAEARQQLNDLEDYVESLDQPWQPLEDGYSNFWFELTNDTLSPWLNFSAKSADATIDWGDGSGEQALTTLTPTHTYSKAGKYVVKCKGVTGIDILYTNTVTNSAYFTTLKYIEYNSEVTSVAMYAYRKAVGIKGIKISATSIGSYAFQYCVNLTSINFEDDTTGTVGAAVFYNCSSLRDVSFSNDVTIIYQAACYNCVSLQRITIPANVTSIGNNAFNGCQVLSEIHVLPTIPPTMGTTPFGNILVNYIIYVPVGYGDTYKSAEGWSSYASHILEEGQTPNRMMLAKFNEKTDEPQDDMR